MMALLQLFACGATWSELDDTAAPDVDDPPVVTLTAPGLGSVWVLGQPIAVTATITDGDDPLENLDVTIYDDVDGGQGSFVLGEDGVLDETVALTVGVHLLTVLATDPDGARDQSSALLRVDEAG